MALEQEVQQLRSALCDYKLIEQSVNDAIIVVDMQTCIQRWNHGAEQMYGWRADEVLGKHLHTVLSTRYLAGETNASATQAILRDTVWMGVVAQPHRAGHELIIDASVRLVHDSSGVPLALVSVNRDITLRKRIEDEQRFLAAASAFLAESLDTTTTLAQIARLAIPIMGDWCMVHFTAADGTVRQVVIEHRDPQKVAQARALELSQRALVQPHQLEVLKTQRTQLFTTLTEAHVALFATNVEQAAVLRGWGLRSALRVAMQVGGLAFGALTFVTAESGRHYTAADIPLAEELAHRAALTLYNAQLYAERSQALDRAQAQASELTTLFNHVPAGLAVYDISPGFHCLRHNANFLQLIGREWQARGSIVGVPLQALFDDVSYAATRQIFETVSASGAAFTIEEYAAVLLPDPQPRYYKWSLTPIKDEHDVTTALLVSALEITERKHAEQQRIIFERKMQETQKLESLGLLAGGIAHDFNNLLVAVLGNAGLALMDLAPESPARGSIEQIEIAAQRAADLTRQMLAYAGKGRFVVELINLNGVISEMTHLLHAVILKNVVLRYALATKVALIEADATQLRQVIMNLVVNAAEAIGTASGVITLSTGAMWADRDYLYETYHISELAEGMYVTLEVSDTGVGMDAATRARIFDPFFTTKFTGRGLGLAAVQGIIRNHHGAMRVYSEVGRGSTFKIILPSVGEARRPVSAVEELGVRYPAGTVLVIDDEADVRAVAGRLLERLGFAVLFAADGREGVHMFRTHNETLAYVLLDMTMPQMSGDEALREMRRINPRVPITLMSGYTEHEMTGRFVGRGLAGFLQKPFTPAQLRVAVQQAFADMPQRD